MNDTLSSQPEANLALEKRTTQLVYALQAASFIFGLTYFAAAVINYAKWPEVEGTWLESHFRWQVNTFWYSLLWGVLGVATVLLLVGYAILFANTVWVIYRIAIGWTALRAGRPIEGGLKVGGLSI